MSCSAWSTARATRRPGRCRRRGLAGAHPSRRSALPGDPGGRVAPGDRWPEPGHPSVSHLDTTVPTASALDAAHERVLALGGELRLDRTDDPDEPLRAYASPAGHVFCVFVG